MPKKKSILRKSTKKKRKLARTRASRWTRTPAQTTGSKIRGSVRASPRTPTGPREDGIGVEDDGESSDVKRIAVMERADSETVKGLAEEGQPFEAEVVLAWRRGSRRLG